MRTCGHPSPRFSMWIASLPRDRPTAHEDEAFDLSSSSLKSEETNWRAHLKSSNPLCSCLHTGHPASRTPSTSTYSPSASSCLLQLGLKKLELGLEGLASVEKIWATNSAEPQRQNA